MLKTRKQIGIVIGILMISIISGSVFFAHSSGSMRELQSLGIDAKNEMYSNLAYKEGFEPAEEENFELKALCKQIKSLGSSTESCLTEIYSDIYVNPSNNTVFVSVTGTPTSIQDELYRVLSPDQGLTIIVRQVDYTREELDLAVRAIVEMDLASSTEEYRISTIYSSTDGKVVVTLLDVTPDSVKALLNDLPESISRDMLKIRKGSEIKLTSLTEKHRPVIGGVWFQGRVGLTTLKNATIGFVGQDSDSDYGFLTAAHAIADGLYDGSHQPYYSTWPINENKIGVTKERSYENMSYADAGWVEFDGGITYSKKLHNEYSNTEFIVKYQDDRDDLTTGDNVRFIGQITGFEACEIDAFGAVHITATDTYFLDQIYLDEPCVQGDSGGPVYQRTYAGNQVYHVTAKGILIATGGGQAYASPIDYCEDELGLTLDLTD